MDFQSYHQKMFQSQQQQSNSFSSMNFYPSPFRHHHQQQHQPSMMNSAFHNPFSTMSKPLSMNFGHHQNHHFMGGHQQRHFQLPPPTFNLQPLPTTSSVFSPSSMMMTPTTTTNSMGSCSNFPSSVSLSNDGSAKEETVREVFFRTLATSLKEANKFYSGKTTTWKNPFLYKTNLCENYCNRSYCRYGVNCWYAHGIHELRCIPESDDLPDPAFIAQYLSFLGLPKNVLDEIIVHAYHAATFYTDLQGFMSSKKSSDLPSIDSTCSASASNSPTIDETKVDLPVTAASHPVTIPKSNTDDKFYSSLASNGGWGEIESALNGIVDENSEINVDDKSFGKSYRLFGDSFNPFKPGN